MFAGSAVSNVEIWLNKIGSAFAGAPTINVRKRLIASSAEIRVRDEVFLGSFTTLPLIND